MKVLDQEIEVVTQPYRSGTWMSMAYLPGRKVIASQACDTRAGAEQDVYNKVLDFLHPPVKFDPTKTYESAESDWDPEANMDVSVPQAPDPVSIRVGWKDFLDSYIQTALWSSTNDEGDPLDDNHGPQDLAAETLRGMTLDCNAFIEANLDALLEIDSGRAGHCFWLTRNGHGTGFQDEETLPDEYRASLAQAARMFGPVNLVIDDEDNEIIAESACAVQEGAEADWNPEANMDKGDGTDHGSLVQMLRAAGFNLGVATVARTGAARPEAWYRVSGDIRIWISYYADDDCWYLDGDVRSADVWLKKVTLTYDPKDPLNTLAGKIAEVDEVCRGVDESVPNQIVDILLEGAEADWNPEANMDQSLPQIADITCESDFIEWLKQKGFSNSETRWIWAKKYRGGYFIEITGNGLRWHAVGVAHAGHVVDRLCCAHGFSEFVGNVDRLDRNYTDAFDAEVGVVESAEADWDPEASREQSVVSPDGMEAWLKENAFRLDYNFNGVASWTKHYGSNHGYLAVRGAGCPQLITVYYDANTGTWAAVTFNRVKDIRNKSRTMPDSELPEFLTLVRDLDQQYTDLYGAVNESTMDTYDPEVSMQGPSSAEDVVDVESLKIWLIDHHFELVALSANTTKWTKRYGQKHALEVYHMVFKHCGSRDVWKVNPTRYELLTMGTGSSTSTSQPPEFAAMLEELDRQHTTDFGVVVAEGAEADWSPEVSMQVVEPNPLWKIDFSYLRAFLKQQERHRPAYKIKTARRRKNGSVCLDVVPAFTFAGDRLDSVDANTVRVLMVMALKDAFKDADNLFHVDTFCYTEREVICVEILKKEDSLEQTLKGRYA